MFGSSGSSIHTKGRRFAGSIALKSRWRPNNRRILRLAARTMMRPESECRRDNESRDAPEHEDLVHRAIIPSARSRSPRCWGYLLVKHPYRHPAGYLVRTAFVLVATDIEPLIVLPGSAVLANIHLPFDLYNSSELDRARTRYRVAPAADICSRCGDARLTICLSRDRIKARNVSV